MPTENIKPRRICFTLPPDKYIELRSLLPHGTQDKLFAEIALGLIPMLKTRQREVLGGILAGELEVDLKLRGVDTNDQTQR